MKSKILIAMFIVACIFACGQIIEKNKLITEQGVGSLKRTDKTPNLGEEYIVKEFLPSDEDEEAEHVFQIYDKNENIKVIFYPDYNLVEIYDSTFKTSEGIKAEMPLSEALKLLGEKNPKVYQENSMSLMFCIDINPNITMLISCNDMKGGHEAFSAWYLKGSGQITVNDFTNQAKISYIAIHD